MEEKHQHLLQPLTPSTTTANGTATTDIPTASFAAFSDSPIPPLGAKNINKVHIANSDIIFRLALIISIGIVSIWANHEASKGFSISIINEAREKSLGKRFDLFYVSNDEASRLVLRTSKFVEDFLYPNNVIGSYTKKQVKQVILRLSGRNLTSPVIVESSQDHDHKIVIHISPSTLEGNDFSHAMFVAVQQGMSRIWLWDEGNLGSNSNLGLSDHRWRYELSGARAGHIRMLMMRIEEGAQRIIISLWIKCTIIFICILL
ncbi:hypothetical protein ACH5RR_028368 [Cinchona calisaya]|uniref:Uncharacterized protein n=1 Tax=Cinchona calisaya TaxID=153742 RepID=A0ABD2YT05_9GENT